MKDTDLQQKSYFALVGTLMTIVSLVFLFYVGSSLIHSTKKYHEQKCRVELASSSWR